jgi:ATP-dependent DNA helicase RecG
MIVIDEQHRFGAAQRLTLQQKDPRADFLLMSATPIPQTLCRTLYGDLQTVVLEKGEWAKKKRIGTHVVAAHRRKKMCEFIRDTIDNSEARALWIVPRVFADQEQDTAGLTDIKTAMKRLRSGPCSRIPAEALHGQCDTQSQQRIIRQFGSGEIRLLVATTIVEVGMDVPQTDIIVVENAERFGLAQLHQLRGRCARGEGQGYCFLLPGSTATDTAMERLNYFCTEKDGFRIAEKDLHMRGPGHVAGLRQSGWERLLFADILRDAALFEKIQQKVAAQFHTAYDDPDTTESA